MGPGCGHHPQFKPPPPLPPPPPSPTPSPYSNFPILAISILGILSTSIFLLSYYVFVIKCCFNWRRSDVITRLSGSGRLGENPLMAYARATQSRGLEESAIRAIPTFRYRKGGGGGGDDGDEQGKRSFHECAVCLNEFQDQERIRLLPNCLHVFHIDCIDTWLQTNANCPLCRSDITTTTPLPADNLMDLASHQNLQHSGDIVIEISNDGMDEVQPATGSTNTDPPPRKAEQRGGHKKERKLHHGSSMGDECIDARGKDERFSIQPMRRSFSMDSSSDRQLYMAVQNILQQNPHFQEESSSSNSGRIRRTFFSFGQCRSSRSSVLPVQNEV
ncbi:RING-H2 finger protein ATL16-like [Phoenix dactylifera]|uniref:RING-type E3 ubiquitin transferase n=1 Tax=Phoenix dactylifera TaxID=42345 RepID=A0A8B7BXQ9_PHODC|nr:RING-H2 finger protein ATL16-like [Phoenix dactylifera]